MFFFFDFEMLTEADLRYLSDNSSIVVDRLSSVSESKGLRNSDIAKLTRWSPSKVSKLLKKSQNLSADDLKMWAKCLGYAPKAFLDDEFNLREYDTAKEVRNLHDLIKKTQDYKDDNAYLDECEDMAAYELPLSMISALDLEATDYITRGHVNHLPIDPMAQEKKAADEGISVSIRHRRALFDDLRIHIDLVISPDRKSAFIGLFASPLNRPLVNSARMQEKDLLMVDSEITKAWDSYSRKNQKWITGLIREGEIISYIYNIDELPDNEVIESDLRLVFDKYCDLIYSKKDGMDIKGRNKIPSHIELYGALLSGGAFDPEVVSKAMKSQGYKCEIDQSHESFEREDGHPHMVPVPLVPLIQMAQFGAGIKSDANCLCLCPICSEKFKHGKKADREQMVFTLFRKHEQALRNNDVNITMGQVMSLNGL